MVDSVSTDGHVLFTADSEDNVSEDSVPSIGGNAGCIVTELSQRGLQRVIRWLLVGGMGGENRLVWEHAQNVGGARGAGRGSHATGILLSRRLSSRDAGERQRTLLLGSDEQGRS